MPDLPQTLFEDFLLRAHSRLCASAKRRTRRMLGRSGEAPNLTSAMRDKLFLVDLLLDAVE
jgi:hypothetical protein